MKRCPVPALLFLVFLNFLTMPLYGQTYHFRNYSTEEGLVQSYIYHLLQSDDGYLWICTGDGLSRYNGKTFQNYTTRDGLAENFITTAFKDHQGNIWLGHYQGGITVFDGNGFSKKNIPRLVSPVNTIIEDNEKNIWIATQSQGLVKILPTGEIIYYDQSSSGYIIHAIAIGKNGEFLAGTNEGLIRLKFKGKNISLVPVAPEMNIGDVTTFFYREKTHSFWIGTKENGIFEFKNESLLRPDIASDLTPDHIAGIYEDSLDNLYLSCYGKGMFKYKVLGDRLLQTDHYCRQTGLSSDYVRSFVVDRENNLWMGTYGNGLDILTDPLFTLYSSRDGLSGENVTAIISGPGGKLIAGTERGVTEISFGSGGLTTEVLRLPGISSQRVKALYLLPNNDMLIAFDSLGILRRDHASGKISTWFHIHGDPLSNTINGISGDHEGNIWIATYGGVYRKKKEASAFEHFTIADGIAQNLVYSIFEDSKGTVWFATHKAGISRYSKGKFETLNLPGSDIFNINCFAEDRNGRLLIGTYGDGIHVFDGKNIVKHYTRESGLGSNYCYLIFVDKNNNIWTGHKEGLTRIDPSFTHFLFHRRQENLHQESVNLNAYLQDISGNLWFGTNKGLLKYNPDADKINITPPLTQITGVDIFFQKPRWAETDSLTGAHKLPYDLELRYDKNHLTFHFSGISLKPGSSLSYQYILEGFDKKWSLLTNETFATYANLPHGNFTFKVRALKDGVWGLPASFSFSILKPFWQTSWFRLLLAAALVGTVILIVRLRTVHLARREAELKKQRDALLAEIRERKIAEEKREESEQKFQQTNKEFVTFIYRSSHDLRGPLASIMGVSNLARKEVDDKTALMYFNMISESAYQLDNILKGIREATMFKDWQVQNDLINFEKIISKVRQCYNEEKEQIRFIVRVDVKTEFRSDDQLITSILQCLADNAVKYRRMAPTGDFVSIEITDHNEGVMIRIRDNGIGIKQSLQKNLFDMFFKASLRSKGAGIGLYLVKNSVERLEGSITIKSEEGNGTEVNVYLPNLFKSESIH